MKFIQVQKFLDGMNDLEFWFFMRKPMRVRMAILKRKAKK